MRVYGAILLYLISDYAFAEKVPQAYREIGARYGVPHQIIYAVAKVESQRYIEQIKIARPWPWTLNIEGKPYFYSTKMQAVMALEEYLRGGGRSVAVGIMQIYWRWHSEKLINPELALDPYYNIEIGTAYLKKKYRDSGYNWLAAIGKYHCEETSEENRVRALNYRKKVINVLERL